MFFIVLMYLGILPILVLTYMHSNQIEIVPYLGEVDELLLSYSSMILAFMSGILWGQKLILKEQIDLEFFIISNILFLLTWFGVTLLSMNWFLLLNIMLYIILLFFDLLMFKKGCITGKYIYNRIFITSLIVIVFLDYIGRIRVFY